MFQEIESDSSESTPALPIDPPKPAPPIKAAALTGALVQRGRDRAPLLPEVSIVPMAAQAEEPAPAPDAAPAAAPVSDEVPLVFAKPRRKEAAPRASRWSEALFVAACCAAFFATFLFVLRF